MLARRQGVAPALGSPLVNRAATVGAPGCQPGRSHTSAYASPPRSPFVSSPLQGVRRIGFAQFCVALELLAAEKGVDKGESVLKYTEKGVQGGTTKACSLPCRLEASAA